MNFDSRSAKETQAFTLIEIAIAVVVVGVLAAVAIPSYMNYRKRAKTLEPANNLAVLYKGAASYYDMNFSQADADAGAIIQVGRCVTADSNEGVPMPATPQAAGTKVDFSSDSTFKSLKFNVPDLIRYSYLVEGADVCSAPKNSSAYRFSAFGDLDNDATLSTFFFDVGINDEMQIYRAPSMTVFEELE